MSAAVDDDEPLSDGTEEYDPGDCYESDGDDDDDAMAGAGALPASAPALQRSKSYVVVTQETVDQQLEQLVREVAEVTCLSEDDAAILLRACHYKKDQVESAWFGDEEKAKAMAGLRHCGKPDPPAFPEGQSTLMCSLCFDEAPADQFDAGPCEHWFCGTCWANHINFSADARGREALVNIECPEPGCGEALRSRIIQKFGDPKVLQKRHAWILDTFATEAQSLRRCANPTRECTAFCLYTGGMQKDIICPLCDYVFCHLCGKEGHSPVSCEDARAWREKFANGEAMANLRWLRETCRPCPKCSLPIEKNGGCMHMVCGKHAEGGMLVPGSGCGTHFCWNCMQPLSGGGHGQCPVWKPTRRMSTSDYDLDMYGAFQRNMDARDFALRTHRRMKELAESLRVVHDMSEEDVRHLVEGAETVVEGRRILANTYMWIYFHNQHVATPLFQLNQTQLHEQLETLQGLLEGQGLMRPVAYELLHSDSPSISVLERWEGDRRAIRNATTAVQDFMTQVVRAVQNEE